LGRGSRNPKGRCRSYRSFGAVGLRLSCVVSGDGCGFFLVRAGLFKAKSNIRKLKETRVAGDTAGPVLPGTVACRPFQAVAGSNPQLVGVIGFLNGFGFFCHREVKDFSYCAGRFGMTLSSVSGCQSPFPAVARDSLSSQMCNPLRSMALPRDGGLPGWV